MMALSLATDLGVGQPIESALRSCLISVRLGQALGLRDHELRDVYYLVLLAYVGCAADAHETARLFDEIALIADARTVDLGKPAQVLALMARRAGEGLPPIQRASRFVRAVAAGKSGPRNSVLAHCEVGQRLAESFGFGAVVQAELMQVFERWDGKGFPFGIRRDAMTLPVRVAQVAMCAEPFHSMSGVDGAVTAVKARARGGLDPDVASCLCQHAEKLLQLPMGEATWSAVLDAEPGARTFLSDAQLETATRAIGQFADLKSPYLLGHSAGVGELAAAAAKAWGLPNEDIVAVRRAGFLHDVGRVGVSTRIWDKDGPLTVSEWERVRLHPYYTERILARPAALARLGTVASLHHERCDGSGYHRGLTANAQPATARLLAAADVYHALTEARPYRAALTPDAAAGHLQDEARSGRLDGDAVNAVLAAAGHRVRAKRQEWPAGLSLRQVEVLRLVARGRSIREIASSLGISRKTADNHIQHVYNKIGVSTRAAAALFAMQHDLIGALEESDFAS